MFNFQFKYLQKAIVQILELEKKKILTLSYPKEFLYILPIPCTCMAQRRLAKSTALIIQLCSTFFWV